MTKLWLLEDRMMAGLDLDTWGRRATPKELGDLDLCPMAPKLGQGSPHSMENLREALFMPLDQMECRVTPTQDGEPKPKFVHVTNPCHQQETHFGGILNVDSMTVHHQG